MYRGKVYRGDIVLRPRPGLNLVRHAHPPVFDVDEVAADDEVVEALLVGGIVVWAADGVTGAAADPDDGVAEHAARDPARIAVETTPMVRFMCEFPFRDLWLAMFSSARRASPCEVVSDLVRSGFMIEPRPGEVAAGLPRPVLAGQPC
jgi:hypothetical protein